MTSFEITGIAKFGGPLTKRISLAPDGSLVSDGSACTMSQGGARLLLFSTMQEFAACVATLEPHEAIALGSLHDDLPHQVEITTKQALNGASHLPDQIARTTEFITYRPGHTGLALIDIDTKGMPDDVRQKVAKAGGCWEALVSVMPKLAGVGRVVRRSTSAGIYRSDTGEQFAGSDGRHVYIMISDASDARRLLQSLHDRRWLAGFGWLAVSKSGQLLDRSLVDRSVYSPERLVFEGAPVLEPPLAQDLRSRAPIVTEGPPLDTRASCHDLSIVERAKARELKRAAAHILAPAVDTARRGYIERFAKANSCTPAAARHIVERQHQGILLSAFILPFDDPDLQGTTVGDVLADPSRFIGETLADPLEGVAYGRCKAKVFQRVDGSVFIHSFAHGRAIYDLKYDAASIEAAIRAADAGAVVDTFVRLLLLADLEPDEEQRLKELVCDRSGIKARPLAAKIKAARERQKHQNHDAERQRQATERTDPRPQLPAPAPDAPWIPEMKVLNEVLGASAKPEPPMRDLDGCLTTVGFADCQECIC